MRSERDIFLSFFSALRMYNLPFSLFLSLIPFILFPLTLLLSYPNNRVEESSIPICSIPLTVGFCVPLGVIRIIVSPLPNLTPSVPFIPACLRAPF